ncbi:MAG: hypothetical protein WCK11_04920 [Candidatus Falkowbacteria bacterium]
MKSKINLELIKIKGNFDKKFAVLVKARNELITKFRKRLEQEKIKQIQEQINKSINE